MWGISWPNEKLVTFQEAFCSMELVKVFFVVGLNWLKARLIVA